MAEVGSGAAFNKLEKTEPLITQGMQFWGGKKMDQNFQAGEAAKQRVYDAAQKGIDRKLRQDESIQRDIEGRKFDFTSKDAGYDSLTENYSAFSRKVADHYSGLWKEYAAARQSGDMKKAYDLEDKMEKAKTVFKEQQQSAEKFKALYTKYEEMAKAGKLSDYDKNRWKIIQGFVKGDSKTTFLDYDPENIKSKWKSQQMNEDGSASIEEITMADVDNGRLEPIYKNDILGDSGLVNKYSDLMGTYEKSYYASGRDVTKAGYSAYAESKIKSAIYNDLDDNEVRDLANQMFQIDGGLNDAESLHKYKSQVVNKLTEYVMMKEKSKDLSKLNLDEAQLQLQREKNNRPKPVSKEDQKYSVRKAQIDQAFSKNNIDAFKSGTFTMGGKKYVASDAKIVNNKIVIQTDKGKLFSFDLNRSTLNELYNNFEGTKLSLDRVENVQASNYELPQRTVFGITDVISQGFDRNGRFNSGLFTAGDSNFAKALKELYPNSKIENNYFGKGDITIDGKPVFLEGKTKLEIEAQLKLQLQREKNNRPKPVSKKDQKYSVHKAQIDPAFSKNNIDAFKSGTFTMGGKKYVASDAKTSTGQSEASQLGL